MFKKIKKKFTYSMVDSCGITWPVIYFSRNARKFGLSNVLNGISAEVKASHKSNKNTDTSPWFSSVFAFNAAFLCFAEDMCCFTKNALLALIFLPQGMHVNWLPSVDTVFPPNCLTNSRNFCECDGFRFGILNQVRPSDCNSWILDQD